MPSQEDQERHYRYSPLTSPTTIRVLAIQESILNPDGPLWVRFTAKDINWSDFEAISYRWGPAPVSAAGYKKVYVTRDWNDFTDTPPVRVIFVRPNLYDCLLELRRQLHRAVAGSRRVWVDALCIDQNNGEEKSKQVQMIGEIFSRASRVVVWLGQHADNSDAAFNLWEKIGADALVPPEILFRQDPNAPLPSDEQRYRATVLAHLFSREYWTRTWIVQEILLAKAIIVCCGKDMIDFESLLSPKGDGVDGKTFHGVAYQGMKIPTRLASSIDLEAALNHVRDLHGLRVQLQHAKSLLQHRRVELHNHSLFELIYQFRDTVCEDPRDKVYALLSLEKLTPQQKQIQVDYQEHRRDLYVRVCESRLTADYETNWQHAESLLKSLSLQWSDLFEVRQVDSGQQEVRTLSQRLEEIRIELGRSGGRDPNDSNLRKARGSTEAYRMQVLAAILDAAEASPGAPLHPVTESTHSTMQIATQGSVDTDETKTWSGQFLQENSEVATATTEKLHFPTAPKSSDPYEERERLKGRLALAFRVFGQQAFGEGVAGHITLRDPINPCQFWVNPFGFAFSQVKRSDLILVDQDGRVIGGGGVRRLHTATYMILVAVHEARPDVMCAVHSHSIHGGAFCTLGRPLDIITQESCAFYNDLVLYDSFRGMGLAREEGRDIARALGAKKAALLQSRGLLTVGQSIEEAVFWFVSLDQCCHRQLIADAAALGRGGQTVKVGDESAANTYKLVGTPDVGWLNALPMFERVAEQSGLGYLQ